MVRRSEERKRVNPHGNGAARKLVRPLSPREVAEFQGWNVLHPGDRRRRAGIEEFRRAVNKRFGDDYRFAEVVHD